MRAEGEAVSTAAPVVTALGGDIKLVVREYTHASCSGSSFTKLRLVEFGACQDNADGTSLTYTGSCDGVSVRRFNTSSDCTGPRQEDASERYCIHTLHTLMP
jgi:hypothetical protein